ncbi:MAG: hypothetical protein KAS05_04500, partial [Candidatus Omnitrophica bacterium]|nr:hypothetical protein [Candidatus Omnitrophota bacterium]
MSLALFISPNFVFSKNHTEQIQTNNSILSFWSDSDRIPELCTQNHPIPFIKTAQASTEAYASSKPSFLNTISNKLTSSYNSLKRSIKTIYNYTLNIFNPKKEEPQKPRQNNTETDNNELIPEEDQPSYDSTLPIEDEEDGPSNPQPDPLPKGEGVHSHSHSEDSLAGEDEESRTNTGSFDSAQDDSNTEQDKKIASLQNKITELEQAIQDKEVITLKGDKGEKGDTGPQGPSGIGNITTVPSSPVNTNVWNNGANVFSGYGSFESLGVAYDLSAGRS